MVGVRAAGLLMRVVATLILFKTLSKSSGLSDKHSYALCSIIKLTARNSFNPSIIPYKVIFLKFVIAASICSYTPSVSSTHSVIFKTFSSLKIAISIPFPKLSMSSIADIGSVS